MATDTNKETRVEHAIIEEYRKMVIEMSMRDIRVTDLCQRAGVSRKAFYTHFSDRDDVLVRIIHNDVIEPQEQLFPLFGAREEGVSERILNGLFYQGFLDHKDFYRRVVTQNEERIFVHALQKNLRNTHEYTHSVCSGGDTPNDEKYEYASDMLASAQAAIVMRWIRTGMKTSTSDLSQWSFEWLGTAIHEVAGA